MNRFSMITKQQAKEIARNECQQKNWPWLEPIYVKWGLYNYTIWGGGRKGGNLIIKIRKKDGEIICSGITPK
jgi:hypothetical protein